MDDFGHVWASITLALVMLASVASVWLY